MKWMMVCVMMLVMGVAMAEEPKPPPVGTAQIPGAKALVAVQDFSDPAPKPKFGKPKEGMKFVGVQLVFLMGEEGDVQVNPMAVDLQCADYAVRTVAFGASQEPELKSSHLKKPKDVIMGWVGFEIPLELKAEECKVAYGFMEKSDWIPLSDAVKRQQKDAPK